MEKKHTKLCECVFVAWHVLMCSNGYLIFFSVFSSKPKDIRGLGLSLCAVSFKTLVCMYGYMFEKRSLINNNIVFVGGVVVEQDLLFSDLDWTRRVLLIFEAQKLCAIPK
jgi:hypothetical protein